MDVLSINDLLKQILFKRNKRTQSIQVFYVPDQIRLVGIGTDAIVVQHQEIPMYVYKMFTTETLKKRITEFTVYQRLGGDPFFSTCFGYGDNYLCLKYEPGVTLYDCLVKGIEIPLQVMMDVQTACKHAKHKGLNPRDIHLKNVILQNGRAKVIDVSEYMNPGNDHRWQYLVQAYDEFYPYIRGKKIPRWLIEMVKKAYDNHQSAGFSVSEFGQYFMKRYRKKI